MYRNLYTYDAIPQEPLARDALILQGAHRSSAIRQCAGAELWAEGIGSSANTADCQAAPLHTLQRRTGNDAWGSEAMLPVGVR
jgi:hypothetical protein